MSGTVVINDDPYAVAGQAALFTAVAVVFAGIAAWIFGPLLHRFMANYS